MRKLVAIFILALSAGCTHYSYFQFASDPVTIANGEVQGGVTANWRFSGPFSETYGNPYNLQISFQTDSQSKGPESVRAIKILSENAEVLYEFSGGEMKSEWSDYNGKWV